MAVDKFSFGAPSVQINEVDQSVTAVTPPVAVGPVIIGRTSKGPSMVPVQVNSILELEQKFGAPENGKRAVADAWRNGGVFSPTYATYAAKAFLQNSAPVTVIRLAGLSNAGTTAIAGWEVKDGNVTTTVAEASGAYGLYVWPYTDASPDTLAASGTLAAVIYTSGSIPKLLNSSDEAVASGTMIYANANHEFKLVIDSASDVTASVSVHDSTAAAFIRNKLNTNPTAVGTLKYWLGETYEGHIQDTFGSLLSTGKKLVGTIMSLNSKASTRNIEAQSAVTPWVVSQYEGVSANFDGDNLGVYPVQNLFRFYTLDIGDSAQKSIKVSVENIKLSANQVVNPYCSFTVSVRSIATDAVLERFADVNLNPDSPRYLGKVVGDAYKTFDPDMERFLEHGQYPNRSSYVRVEISDSINAGHVPCGFYLPPTFGNEVLTNSASAGSRSTSLSKAVNLTLADGLSAVGTYNVIHPKIKCRKNNEGKTLSRVRWGLQVNSTYNKDLVDHSRIKTIDGAYEPSTGNGLVYPAIFTLQEIVLNTATNEATWTEGSLDNDTSYYADDGGANKNLGTMLDTFNSFDMPFYGGFEGVDITKKEPFIDNVSLANGKTVTNDYAYYTISTAIDMLADPEAVEMDLVSIPGLTLPALTDKLIDVCELRGDAMAVIDLEDDYIPAHEGSEALPSLNDALVSIEDRQLNSSYAAAWYPAVYSATENVYLPASVAAMGILGGTEGRSELWFAPAGFTRGGINQTSAGLSVSKAAIHLSSKDRDSLYNFNINPIATFPREGVVAFGQKTLLAENSALNRINVRRLVNHIKRELTSASYSVLFEPNVEATWKNFKNQVQPFMDDLKIRLGLEDYRVELDASTTTADLIDRNTMYAKVFIRPARTIEYIAIDLVITSSGVSLQ